MGAAQKENRGGVFFLGSLVLFCFERTSIAIRRFNVW